MIRGELEAAKEGGGMTGVVLAGRRHLRATPKVNQGNHQIAECDESLVGTHAAGRDVVLTKDGIAEPEQALDAPSGRARHAATRLGRPDRE
jgi:hypothetical protein